MTCYDSDNLPPGLVPSGLPGNSRKEMAVERAMEKAYDRTQDIADGLRIAAMELAAFRDGGPDELSRFIRKVSSTVEELQSELDDALNILGQLDE